MYFSWRVTYSDSSSLSCRMRPLTSRLPSAGQIRPRLVTLHQQHQHLQQLRHGGKPTRWNVKSAVLTRINGLIQNVQIVCVSSCWSPAVLAVRRATASCTTRRSWPAGRQTTPTWTPPVPSVETPSCPSSMWRSGTCEDPAGRRWQHSENIIF